MHTYISLPHHENCVTNLKDKLLLLRYTQPTIMKLNNNGNRRDVELRIQLVLEKLNVINRNKIRKIPYFF